MFFFIPLVFISIRPKLAFVYERKLVKYLVVYRCLLLHTTGIYCATFACKSFQPDDYLAHVAFVIWALEQPWKMEKRWFLGAADLAGPSAPWLSLWPRSALLRFAAWLRGDVYEESITLCRWKTVLKEQREFCDEVYLTFRCFAYLLNVKLGHLQGLLVLRASL